ncbi:MAG: hypothetical protein DRP79_01900 [Planctomycetota bacterium]|nr:MAG: hypothetical protein DRP79_01900 [Planctomycetota bacterium]
MFAQIDVRGLLDSPFLKWLFNLQDLRFGKEVFLELQNPLQPWLLVLILAPVIFLVGLVYYKEAGSAGTLSKGVMAGMRLLVVLLALVIFMEPVVKSENTDLFRKVVLVMIDTSGSMSTVDKNLSDEEAKKIAEGLYNLQGEDVKKLKRLDYVKDFLTNPSIKFFERLEEKGTVKVVLFDSKIRYDEPKVFEQPGEGEERRKFKPEALAPVEAEGMETNVPGAVRDAIIKSGIESGVAGVIIISDGRTSGISPQDLKLNQTLAEKVIGKIVSEIDYPIYCVWVGTPEPPRNLMAKRIEGPVKSTKDSKINLDVYFRAEQYSGGEQVEVILERLDLDKKGGKWEAFDTKKVTLLPPEEGKTGREMKVRFEFKPKEKGRYQFRAKVELLDDEADPTDNMTKPPHRLDVTDRRIKVLYVEGTPRWEYRYLKNVLIRKKDEFVVWCLLLSADMEFPQEHTQGRYLDKNGNEKPIEPLKKFPDKEELMEFDVIIWGDVDPTITRYNMGPDTLANVREFVETGGAPEGSQAIGGGGLICILGENFFPRLYGEGNAGWELGKMLPFTIREPKTEFYKDRTESFKFKLTDSGRTSPLFMFKEDPQENERYWSSWKSEEHYGLPGSFWFWPIEEDPAQKQGAKVFVRHEKAKPEKAEEDAPTYALFFEKDYGKGIIFVSAIDDTWRWRYEYGDEPYFAPFWLRIVKRVAEHRFQSETRYLLDADRDVYVKGKHDINVEAKVLGENFQPIGLEEITVRYKRRGGESHDLILKRREGEDTGRYTGVIPGRDMETGDYEIWLEESATPHAESRVDDFFTVKLEDRESADRTADPTFLTALAAETGTCYKEAEGENGKVERLFPIYAIGEIPDKIEGGDVPVVVSVSNAPIWASWLFLLLILVFLCVEWIVRKSRKLI